MPSFDASAQAFDRFVCSLTSKTAQTESYRRFASRCSFASRSDSERSRRAIFNDSQRYTGFISQFDVNAWILNIVLELFEIVRFRDPTLAHHEYAEFWLTFRWMSFDVPLIEAALVDHGGLLSSEASPQTIEHVG